MYIQIDNIITYNSNDNIEAFDKIPTNNWLLKYNERTGEYYLERTHDFKLPSKLYGDVESISKRYINTFSNKEGNLGILLDGLKGTGKSITAKLTAKLSNLPVIIITEPFCDENFKSFLSNIKQKVVVLIDEFEKVYHDVDKQNDLLSILDGVFEGSKLFIFTSNDKSGVNKYMLNRTGRIHYLKEYDSLSDDIVNDVIDDNLLNKNEKLGLIDTLNILGTVTMDTLTSLIFEMNLYDESSVDSIKQLNIKPSAKLYKVDIFKDGIKLGEDVIYNHPLENSEIELGFDCKRMDIYNPIKKTTDDEKIREEDIIKSDYIYVEIDLTKDKVERDGKKIIIINKEGLKCVFRPGNTYKFVY